MTADEVYHQLSNAYAAGSLEGEHAGAHHREGIRGEVLEGYEEDSEADVEQDQISVPEERVGKAEVESRDEGFGGGREAEEFDEDIEVDSKGRVRERDDSRGRSS